MIRKPMASSNIRSAGYNAAAETLEIEFLNGTIYQYYNIGAVVWDQFCQAPSKGTYLNVYIKNAYPFSRVG